MNVDDPLIRTLTVNGEKRIAAFQLTPTVSGGVFLPTFGEVARHFVLAGPETGDPAIMVPRLLVAGDTPYAAILADPNVFFSVNAFHGIRLIPRVVTTDYTLLPSDSVIVVIAASNDVTLTLPAAIGTGQTYRIKRIDGTAFIVTVQGQSGELIDGEPSVTLDNQFSVCTFVDEAVGYWDKGFFGGEGLTLPTNVAILDENNVFIALNTFTGIRLATRTVMEDYTLTELDYAILGLANDTSITVYLPPATGSGQVYRVKKGDPTINIVHVRAVGTDTIDGSISVDLVDQWSNVEVMDFAPGYWDNARPPIDALLVPDTPPPTPTTLNEVIALLQSYDLCA